MDRTKAGTPIYWVYRLLSSEEIATEDDKLSSINAAYGISEAEKTGTIPVEEAVWWHPHLMLFLSDDNGGGIAVDRKTDTVWDWDHDGGLFGLSAPSIGIFFEIKLDKALRESFQAKGHKVVPTSSIGVSQAISLEADGTLTVQSDPRIEGSALGF